MSARPVRWTIQHIGRRGTFLLFLSVLDISFGFSFFFPPRELVLVASALVIPVTAWAWIWTLIGVCCAASAPFRRDRVAFSLASALFAAWASVGLNQWLALHTPRGWLSPIIFYCFALTVLIIASWPEAPIVVDVLTPEVRLPQEE